MVATPIGNLGDMTLRGLETLKSVDAVACEDTRVTGKLLNHFGITVSTISYHEHNKARMDDSLIARLQTGARIALVSDAGTPLIADPGASLIGRAHAAGIMVIPIPGACAAISALCVAGLGGGDMYFAGFLPASGKERHAAIRKLVAMPTTLVLYEAPHRIHKTLGELAEALGEARPALLARELTKMHETLYRGTLRALEQMTGAKTLKGEMVIVIAPPEAAATDDALAETMLRDALTRLPATKAAAEVAAATGKKRADLYALALSFKENDA